MSKILTVDSVSPNPESIARAGKTIRQGGVVIFPAKCMYGVAANALNHQSVEKVFNLKQRPQNMPILVLVKNRCALKNLVVSVSDEANKLMDVFWPGDLTLVFKAKNHIPALLTANTGKIGIRVPFHPVAKALVDTLDFPITGTSANLSGHVGCSDPVKLHPAVLEASDLILDSGPLKGGRGSSIVNVTTSPPTVLREGEISKAQIIKALQFH